MELSPVIVVVGLLATFVVGISKGGVPSVGAFGAALLATVIPAVASTGVLLPVLLLGDAVAIAMYARHADVRLLVRLLPGVSVGLAAGYLLVRVADPDVVTRVIGAVLLLSAVGALLRRRRPAAGPTTVGPASDAVASPSAEPARAPAHPLPARARGPVSLLLGAGAGLSTMVANAGGPMMTLYLLRMRVGTLAFLGTSAWFFLSVNLLKVPLSVGLGLITPDSLRVSAVIAPGILLGALVGRRLARGMSREVFELAALLATAAAALWLLVG